MPPTYYSYSIKHLLCFLILCRHHFTNNRQGCNFTCTIRTTEIAGLVTTVSFPTTTDCSCSRTLTKAAGAFHHARALNIIFVVALVCFPVFVFCVPSCSSLFYTTSFLIIKEDIIFFNTTIVTYIVNDPVQYYAIAWKVMVHLYMCRSSACDRVLASQTFKTCTINLLASQNCRHVYIPMCLYIYIQHQTRTR